MPAPLVNGASLADVSPCTLIHLCSLALSSIRAVVGVIAARATVKRIPAGTLSRATNSSKREELLWRVCVLQELARTSNPLLEDYSGKVGACPPLVLDALRKTRA